MLFLRRCLLLGSLVVLLTGCGVLHPWATNRDIEGSYDQVFRATLETLRARQFPIETADRDAGRIVTGPRPVRVIEARRRVERVRARIEGNGSEVDVQLFLTFTDQSGTVQRRAPDGERAETEAAAGRVLSSSAIYDECLDAIEDRVAALRDET
jgi:hypothetical protein